MTDDGATAVLLTGVYGAGKTTVAEEVAALLEEGTPPFAALDLDWLTWSSVPGADHDETAILLANLRAVAGTFRRAGARRFVIAGSVNRAALAAIREALAMPVLVIRLEVPIEVIEARLSGAATSGRADDLAAAREQLSDGEAAALADEFLDGTRPVAETARAVVALAGWTLPQA
jgi:adenylylsulfate kinase-like enzyme